MEKFRVATCGRCGTKGKWAKVKAEPKTGLWIWCCGGLTSKEGCARTPSQSVLFAHAFGITDIRDFKEKLSITLWKRIGKCEVRAVATSRRLTKRQATEECVPIGNRSEAVKVDEESKVVNGGRSWVEKLGP